ncbi:uncharacterized protein LOC131947543 [Physella acuta]|uniref:uncharacterized protein LOC131947543 n=1 Tax=Physella acuta TaxID=109671 RepID=UPI0027DDD2D2|nr:uncharacterized protein LOC131947543 [Physella acuta]
MASMFLFYHITCFPAPQRIQTENALDKVARSNENKTIFSQTDRVHRVDVGPTPRKCLQPFLLIMEPEFTVPDGRSDEDQLKAAAETMGNNRSVHEEPLTQTQYTHLDEKRRYLAMLKEREDLVWEQSQDDVTDTEFIEVTETPPKYAEILPEDFLFPFENLIFEGGGNKGLAYVGGIKYLEEIGMMPRIRRFGGSSAGAITATLVALGYSSCDIEVFMSDDLEEIFLDHSCGYFSLLPNLLSKFGWNPGDRFSDWCGDMIKEKSSTANPDMTFYDLYRERRVELCIVVTNLNQMRSEYCHPKTTPDMPIREAVRMSMALPGLFTARFYDNHGRMDTYVDGGLLCNYPIHCFDGWCLSMAKEDSFMHRVKSLRELPYLKSQFFQPPSNKTVGFLVYDDVEMEIMRYRLEHRYGCNEPATPSKQTKLFELKQTKKAAKGKADCEHRRIVKAVENFMKALNKHNLDDNEFIDKHKLQDALEDTRFQGFGRRDVQNLGDFLSALMDTMLTNLKYVFVKESDDFRTVGINTGHIGTSDYALEEADKEFLIQRGYNATRAFLKYYVAKGRECQRKTTGHLLNGGPNTDVTDGGLGLDTGGPHTDVTDGGLVLDTASGGPAKDNTSNGASR